MASPNDYLEHLRAIHFTLIVASIALLIVASTRQPSLASKAHSEFRELIALKDDLKNVQSTIEQMVIRSNKKSNLHIDPHANGLSFVVLGQRVTFPAVLDTPEWVILPDSDEVYPEQFTSLPTMDTLNKSRLLWDWMSHPFDVYVVDGLTQPGYLVNYDGPSHVKVYEINYSLVDLQPARKPKHFTIEPLPFRSSTPTTQAYKNLSKIRAAYDLFFDYSDFNIRPLGDTSNLSGNIPVKLSPIGQIDLLGAWISDHHNLTHRSFAANFPALTQFASGYENLQLSRMENLIAQEEQLSKTPTNDFELFGMKFPASDAFRWGGGIIVAIQLYLFFTIVECIPRLARSEPEVVQTPWIGVYQSRSAYILAVLTATVLPLIAILSVGLQASAATDGSYINWVILILSAVIEVVLFICLIHRMAQMRRLINPGSRSFKAKPSDS